MKKCLTKIKVMINDIMDLLEVSLKNMSEMDLTDKQRNILELVVGKKESVISAILKLTTILLRIEPFETDDNFALSEIDISIINDFLKKYSDIQKKLD